MRPKSHPSLTRLILLTSLGIAFAGPPCRADDDVAAKRALVKHADPTYPELARQMHLGGAVMMHVVIAADGHVMKVNATSGHPLLVAAAESAVRGWQYAPAHETTEGTVQVVFVAH